MGAHLLRHAHALPTDHALLLGLVDIGTAFWLVLYVLATLRKPRLPQPPE